ncbi:MAG: hypothetical protein AAFX90_10285 [Pseudomonadota bacterium]
MYSVQEMIDQHKQREDGARETLIAIGKSDRPMTVGKHEAKNHNHLKSVLAEADEVCPRAADTIRWLFWHECLDAQLMHAMMQRVDASEGDG